MKPIGSYMVTLHPKSYTKPHTLNPKPYTLNPWFSYTKEPLVLEIAQASIEITPEL